MKKYIQWMQQNRKKVVIWAGSGVAACLLFSVLILPMIIKSQAESQILKATGRVTTIEAVRFNPFGMTLTVRGFSMAEATASQPFVRFSSLRVSLSSASLYRFAPVVDELTLSGLDLKLVRTAANRYNFSDILDRLAAAPQKKSSGSSRFSINNISLQNSSIDFNDLAVPGGKQHTIRNLRLAIPFISNIPYLAEKYTDPQFSADVNGAHLSFSGKAKPLAKAIEANLNLKLRDLNLPYYLAYLPADIPVRLESGSASLDLNLTYRIHKNKQPELLIKGVSGLDNIAVAEKNHSPLVGFKHFEVQIAEAELFNRVVALKQVLLDGLQLVAERDSAGVMNFKRITPQKKSEKADAVPPKNKQKPMQLTLEKLVLSNGGIRYLDKLPAGGFKAALQDINLQLTGLSTAQNVANQYQLSLKGDQGESFKLQGSAMLSPASTTCTFELNGVKLQRAWPYLQQRLTAPINGSMKLAGAASWNKDDGATVKDLGLQFNNLRASYGQQEATTIALLGLSGINYSQKQNRAEVAEIRLSNGAIQLSREQGGALSALSLLKPAPATPQTPPPAPVKSTATPAQPPLSWLVKKVTVDTTNLTMRDKGFEEPPVYHLNNIKLGVSHITGPTLGSMPVSFSTTYGKDSPIRLSGNLTPKPLRYTGSLQFSKLPLSDFDSYIPESVHLYLLAGYLDSTLKLDVGLDKESKPTGTFSGSIGLRGLHTVDSQQEEDLLKWESLQLDQINGNLSPLNVSIHQIALNNVFSRIAIRKDKSINLQQVATGKQPATDSKQQAAASEKAAAAGKQQVATAKPQIRIDSVTIQDGTIDFSDAHLPQQFRSTFHNLGGRITGLSSEMNSRAEVDLRGNLENHSPLQITGSINPLREDLFVDLTIGFKDIDLAPATPYSGTYLGYEIDKGKLFLDLKYHIENKNLQASNKVFVDQFTFGESVKSDKATKLPVRLGVALLKDRNGQIKLDLPVTGRTDDPKLSIWGMVWQVVGNLFIKAATSPFSLLSSVFGSGEDLSSINFAPGSTQLTAAEEKKLSTLATGLAERPGLKLELSGFVDPQHDPEAYRYELLSQKMRHEKYLDLVKNHLAKEGDDAERMMLAPAEQSRYLKAVYLKEKFPKPRNMLGMVKDLPDDEMRKLIIANTKIGDNELQQLATRRIAVVRKFLVGQGKLDSQRIFQKQEQVTKPPKQSNSPASRVELTPLAS